MIASLGFLHQPYGFLKFYIYIYSLSFVSEMVKRKTEGQQSLNSSNLGVTSVTRIRVKIPISRRFGYGHSVLPFFGHIINIETINRDIAKEEYLRGFNTHLLSLNGSFRPRISIVLPFLPLF